MQKEIIQGIPFWKDKSNNLYSFETDKKLHIGTYNSATDTYTLKDNWEQLYDSRLKQYRENLNQRDRKENKQK
jgi:hypothetical protein